MEYSPEIPAPNLLDKLFPPPIPKVLLSDPHVKDCAPVKHGSREIPQGTRFCKCGCENDAGADECSRCHTVFADPQNQAWVVSQMLKALETEKFLEMSSSRKNPWGEFHLVCPNEACIERKNKLKDPKILEKIVGFLIKDIGRGYFLCCVCRHEWSQPYTPPPTLLEKFKTLSSCPKKKPETVVDGEKNPLLKKAE